MVINKEIYDIIDKAIIKTLRDSGAETLRLSEIVEGAHILSRKPRDTLKRRVYHRLKGDKNYLINVNTGIYKLNPEFNFIFVGKPLPSELRRESDLSKRRANHSSDLKQAIKIWIENFPKPPGLLENSNFLYMVQQCEQHPLFQDLFNHLAQSGFEVCGRWVQYKKAVEEMGRDKNDLKASLESLVSNMFNIKLNFVEFQDIMQYDDIKEFHETKGYDELATPRLLNDFECSLPSVMFDQLLYKLDIDHKRLESLKRESAKESEKRDEGLKGKSVSELIELSLFKKDVHSIVQDIYQDNIDNPGRFVISALKSVDEHIGKTKRSALEEGSRYQLEVLYKYDIRYYRLERIKVLPIMEKDSSIIWGESKNMELIRLPKSYSKSLIEGKEKALSFFLKGPNLIIQRKVQDIFSGFSSLEQERSEIIQELERSLYCISFSGDCKYLGA